MPKKGFSSITVSDRLKRKLRIVAKKKERSIPDTIEIFVDKALELEV